jgi:hypothetical protein
MAGVTLSTTTRMPRGPSSAQFDNLLPGTRADAVSHRSQRLELIEHASSSNFASTTADCTADSAGWNDPDARAEQRRCPYGRFERDCGGTVTVR